MIINKILSSIFINTLVIYTISEYLPNFFHIQFNEYSLRAYLTIWAIFWFLDVIVKQIVKILTLPLNILTLGLLWIFINILFMYLFQYVINNYESYLATVQLWTFIQVLIISIVIYVLNFLFKKL